MKQITPRSFLSYPFVGNPYLSPTAPLLAFTVQRADLDANCYRGDVFLYDLEQGTTRQLTSGRDALDYRFLPDGNIIFKASRTGDLPWRSAYYVIDPNGGEARKAYDLPLRAGLPHIMEDGRWLICASIDLNAPDYCAMEPAAAKAEWDKNRAPVCEVLEENPYWHDGGTYTSRIRHTLYTFDPKTEELQRVTPEWLDVYDYDYRAGRIAYTGFEYQRRVTEYAGAWLLDMATGKVMTLVEQDTCYTEGPHFMDDDTVLVPWFRKEDHSYSFCRFYLYDVHTGEGKLIAQPELTMGSNSVNCDSKMGGGHTIKLYDGKLYFLTTEHGDGHLRCMDKEGNISEPLTALGSTAAFDISERGLFICALRGDKMCELYQITADGERQLTHVCDDVIAPEAISTPIPLTFTASDGWEIEGWVMRPTNYEAGKRYPAILHVHGGPRTVFGPIFHNEMQMWANNGYYVLFCNPRGSDGRGFDFADIRGKYLTVDYQNLMDFTDEALRQYPDIDPARMGVAGGSYGGLMTNWITSHTTRFAAAATQRSIVNWLSFEGTCDVGPSFTLSHHNATVATNPQYLWDISPLKYADAVRTPTLIIHSDQDYRCHHSEGLQWLTALSHNGIETRLCLFHGESHGLSRNGRPQGKLRRMEEILNFMDKHLK